MSTINMNHPLAKGLVAWNFGKVPRPDMRPSMPIIRVEKTDLQREFERIRDERFLN